MTTKNKIVFGLMLTGAMVGDVNIYLGLLCIATGTGVFFFVQNPKKPKKTKTARPA